ncbi:MAG: hypothetical protein WCT53_04295 [Candidatus Gracilibacteria bacterium]
MFQGFLQKNKEEIALNVGNAAIFILLVASFVWFLMFSASIINDALNVKTAAGVDQKSQFKIEEFKKIKSEFFSKKTGASVNAPEPALPQQ